MTEKIMDSSAGYVCGINSLSSRPFPTAEVEIIPLLMPILRQTLKTKLLMEIIYTLVRSEVNNSDDYVHTLTRISHLPFLLPKQKAKVLVKCIKYKFL